jgi:hypothetical protein
MYLEGVRPFSPVRTAIEGPCCELCIEPCYCILLSPTHAQCIENTITLVYKTM